MLLNVSDDNKRIIFYVFGYLQYPEDSNVQLMMEGLCYGRTDNIVLLDWSKYSNGSYSSVFRNAEKVGSLFAQSMQLLVDSGLDVSRIYIVGHSLGAHIAGFVSKCNAFKIPRITALDPANPVFYLLGCYLTPNDAEWVDVIHTDKGGYGTPTSMGTADYYVNGGTRPQPGCQFLGLPLSKTDLIKDILVKNFESFPNRHGFAEFNDRLLKKNLASLHGEKWRNVRNLLSPSFTSSKMKTMFTLMSECAMDFAKFLSSLPVYERNINMKDVFSKYTNDVIATCAFGIKTNSTKDPMNKIYINAKEASNLSGLRGFKFIFLKTFPRFGRILNIKIVNEYVTRFFEDIIKTTIATRDAEHITRPDMLQLMMDIKDKEGRRELDIDDMTAQAFIFFVAGFETSSTAMSFVAHEIAANPDVQTKLQQEIDNILEESHGEVSYEAINQLEYLDAVINEALRLYPPIPVLERVCEKTFELPSALPNGKSFIVKKGMTFWIPNFAIQRDEKYYNSPEKFDPERFLNDKMHSSSWYMPFGLGPRMCIAYRFAVLEIKILMFHLLTRCDLKFCTKTISPMKFAKHPMIMPENGFWLNIQRRKDMHPVVEYSSVDATISKS
ncbi:Cytochrome P450 9e2 [Trachymyrmex zeteki]|uniref:Cytochrome P450 9e2 n=1 Tax=Mycetomoellerius zeteki TaxID=64791 RepID=A0A151XJ17_9HYME|nr:Cytochrome P450 9e2 [Trachymyrmex zeteki]